MFEGSSDTARGLGEGGMRKGDEGKPNSVSSLKRVKDVKQLVAHWKPKWIGKISLRLVQMALSSPGAWRLISSSGTYKQQGTEYMPLSTVV